MTESLLANLRNQVHWLRAAVNLLMAGSAVAGGVVCFAVENLTTLTRAKDVVAGGERIAIFSAELVWD